LKIADNLRRRVRRSIKVGSAIRDMGCSQEEFHQYIESLFYTDPTTQCVMTWNNYGADGWVIDHIIPLALFDLSDRGQFLKACHYTNLQPLWWRHNLLKSDRIMTVEEIVELKTK
jgi:hypothetical protein